MQTECRLSGIAVTLLVKACPGNGASLAKDGIVKLG